MRASHQLRIRGNVLERAGFVPVDDNGVERLGCAGKHVDAAASGRDIFTCDVETGPARNARLATRETKEGATAVKFTVAFERRFVTTALHDDRTEIDVKPLGDEGTWLQLSPLHLEPCLRSLS